MSLHEAPGAATAATPRYRFQVELPDGQIVSGEVTEREPPPEVYGKCRVPNRHATMAAVLAQLDRATNGPRVHVVRLTPLDLREDG